MKKILIIFLAFFSVVSSGLAERKERFIHIIITLAIIFSPGKVWAGKYIASRGKPVENQFILVFKDDAVSQSNRAEKLNELAAANNGGVLRVYNEVLNGGAVTMSEAKARGLANHPDVAWVEQDAVVTINAPVAGVTWGLDRIDQRSLPLDSYYIYNYDGSGVHAYIIDTGIRASHDEFSGRTGGGYDSVDNDLDPDDCNGHGTHVAGTVGGNTYGVAKGVTLHGVRVLDCGGFGSYSGVIAGVEWVTANKVLPAVANMSLGGGTSPSLDTAVNNSVAAGIVYAVSAGNSNADACNYSPAGAADAITVGATSDTDDRSSFSNWGACVDIFAPGSSITSAWYSSDSAINTISGTSMASPHVAGVAALLREEDPNADVQTLVETIATQGVLSNIGSGSPDLLLHNVDDGTQATPPLDNDNESPVAAFSVSINDFTVTFTDESTDNVSVDNHLWDFGDGSVYDGYNTAPQHTYSGNGNYTAELTVIDRASNSDRTSEKFRIRVSSESDSGSDTSSGKCTPGEQKKNLC